MPCINIEISNSKIMRIFSDDIDIRAVIVDNDNMTITKMRVTYNVERSQSAYEIATETESSHQVKTE